MLDLRGVWSCFVKGGYWDLGGAAGVDLVAKGLLFRRQRWLE